MNDLRNNELFLSQSRQGPPPIKDGVCNKATLPNPTPYKISTITATGRANTIIDLDALFESIEIQDVDSDDEGIVFAEYGSRKSESIHKGYAKKLKIARRNHNAKKRFDNQITLVYKYLWNGARYVVNAKIFKNGHIQMTGLKHVDQGLDVIAKIMSLIQGYKAQGEGQGDGEGKILASPSLAPNNITDYKIRLINCDFRMGFEIRRDQLHRCVCRKYDVMSSFEPCIYPGCKIQYWYNRDRVKDKGGVCMCVGKCNGKGSGMGDGQCKKITIAVFQSGCVIITGGQSMAQVDETYAFIRHLLTENHAEIHKKPLSLLS
jgi:hypothetical protein